MLFCDWSGLQDLYRNVRIQLGLNQAATPPFGYQAICDDEASLLACAKHFTQDKYPAHASAYVHPAWPPHIKIRLGYLCGEFREHATSILMAEVWERHDRRQFETFAFDNGLDQKSLRATHIKQAFDHAIDISHMQDFEVAELIYAQQIDILVNLNGFTGRERNNVFAMRPSPVQVNYLGFPGTMGAPYMDYLIADETVIPPSSQGHYTEKVVYLPDCYQPNDARRVISKRVFTRQELGLPPDGFVFCCFNNNFKITPDTFDVWMRILQQVPGSVLWLFQDTPEVARNLQHEATLRGVDANRLIFAERMSNAEHLARHAMADLFLDTLQYNAHTTASDALWAGLPLLTLCGTTFPGRVATSLLRAVHCEDMVCTSVDEFEAKAIHLATHPDALAHARQTLVSGKKSGPLYNTELFTQNFEQVLLKMVHS
jgi:predicted O-linked N-acetylglucosamine transferase (SPINDLY family)